MGIKTSTQYLACSQRQIHTRHTCVCGRGWGWAVRVWVGGCMCADNEISGLALHPIFHRFSLFNSCLSVVLWLTPIAVFCLNK